MKLRKLIITTSLIILWGPVYADLDSGSSSSYSVKDLPKDIPALVESEDYSNAISALEEFIEKEDENPDAWNLLAFSQRKTGLYDESLASYKKALKLDSKHIGAHEYIGELYLTLNDPKKAKKHLKKLKKYCGSDCEQYQELAKLIDEYEAGS